MKKRILVVDDSPSVRQMICFTLTGAGFDTDEAGDGQQALTKAQSGAYNMVFTDQNMPVPRTATNSAGVALAATPTPDGVAVATASRQRQDHAHQSSRHR